MHRLTAAVALGLVASLAAPPVRADVPLMMPVQGVLRDNAGAPVAEGTFGITFSLYAAETGGDPVWSESWPPAGETCVNQPEHCVAVQSGVFHTLLGTFAPLDPTVFAAAPELWLGLTVETDPELPRRRLGSTAYALHAGSAKVAGGLSCTGCVGTAQLDSQELASEIDQYLTLNGYQPGAPYGDADVQALLDGGGYQKATDPIQPSQLPPGLLDSAGGVFSNDFASTFTLTPGAGADVIKGFNYQPDQWTKSLPSLGTTTSFSVKLDIQHTDVSELEIWLIPPAGLGEAVKLHDKGLPGVSHMVTTYSDGDALPSGTLAQFVGVDVAGTWTLTIFDGVAPPPDDGKLISWSFEVHYQPPSTTALDKTVVLDSPVVQPFVAAEDIDTSSAPGVVSFDGAANGVRVSDGTDPASAARVVGVAIVQPPVEKGDTVLVQTSGVVAGYAGLSAGGAYYLSPTAGAVSTAVGPTAKFVGTAVGADKLLIQLRQPELETRRIVRKNPGTTNTNLSGTAAQQSTDFTIEVECGFAPRTFEGIVHLGIVWGDSWSYYQNAWHKQASYYVSGDVGGSFTAFGVSESAASFPPQNAVQPSPFAYGDNNYSTSRMPDFYAGSTTATAFTQQAYSNTSNLSLKSITASGTKLIFTFAYKAQGSSNSYGLRYGVSFLTVRG